MKLTRRRFIQTATLLSPALPMLVPHAVFGANERIGIAVVAAGSRGRGLARFFCDDSRTTVMYITDPYLDLAKSACGSIEKSHGHRPKPLVDFRLALEDKNVDAVACAAANHWHALTAIWAMQAGKHCYIEKPLTYNLFESKAIVSAAKKSGVVFQTGTQCRSAINIIQLVDFIRSGGIGEVNFVRALCYKRRKTIGPLGVYKLPKSVDYDFWCGPAPLGPMTRKELLYDWHWQRRFGNGDLGNQGSHQLDVARWILDVNRFPKSVVTYGGRLGYDIETKNSNYVDAGDTPNVSTTIFDFGDKSLVFEDRGLETPLYTLPVGSKQGTQVGLIVYGTNGYAIQGWNKTGQTFALSYAFDKNGELIKEFKSSHSDGTILSQTELGIRHIDRFISAVAANNPKDVATDSRCGALSVALSHLANISYYLGEKNKVSPRELKIALQNVKSLDDNEETLGRMLTHLKANGVDLRRTPLAIGPQLEIDVQNETIVGNEEATQLSTREYRKPYVVPDTI